MPKNHELPRKFVLEDKKVLLFDLNGTLQDEEATGRACLKEVFSEWTGRWLDEQGSQLDLLWSGFQNARAKHVREEPGQRLQLALLGAVQAAQLPLPNMDGIVKHMAARYRKLRAETALPHDGMPEVLARLAGRYTLACVSNGTRARTAQRLQLLQLETLFPPERRFDAETLRARKPLRRFFAQALRSLRVEPHEAVVIGDSWRRDAAGAAACGIDAVWLNVRRAKKPSQPLTRGKAVIAEAESAGALARLLGL
ncbi:HAD family hydrolase [Paenibacillus gansuensis]|uniref:HAD family hydrolase n=1 Tax=Paenibacillus gansuensis TaxID=306542 RepID=A0ABW5PEK6_9BACL